MFTESTIYMKRISLRMNKSECFVIVSSIAACTDGQRQLEPGRSENNYPKYVKCNVSNVTPTEY